MKCRTPPAYRGSRAEPCQVPHLGIRVVPTVRPETERQKAELHWECSKLGKWFMILATGWSTGLDGEGNVVAHPATNSVRTFFKACWAQEKPLTHPVQSFN